MLIDGPNRLREIPIEVGIPEIEIGVISMEDPGKDRILGEIVMRAIGQHIEIIDILDVGDLAL